jgi:glutamyl/glutaminyl-tRNA synthetase
MRPSTESPARPLTRFAPAPTGFLHLGHVVNAIYVWGLTRVRGGRVLLRVEDHDGDRCRPEYERAILDDLDWLGFVPDVFPTAAFRAGWCESRQRDRAAVYGLAAEELAARGLVYGCTCSRQDVVGAVSGAGEGEVPYPGTCRARGVPPGPGVTWRVRLEPGVETFDDLLCGTQAQEPSSQCGDVAIRDRRGNWTYQFAASVDDYDQGVNLVIRGRDLLASTGRQIRLARLLGRRQAAAFAHHPLVMKTPTQKLSKSDRDTGVGDLRAAGWTAVRIIGEAARRAGLATDPHGLEASGVSRLFSVEE